MASLHRTALPLAYHPVLPHLPGPNSITLAFFLGEMNTAIQLFQFIIGYNFISLLCAHAKTN